MKPLNPNRRKRKRDERLPFDAFDRPERSGCLSLFMLAHGFYAVAGTAYTWYLLFTVPDFNHMGAIMVMFLMCVYIVYFYGAWHWKRWGYRGLQMVFLTFMLMQLSFSNFPQAVLWALITFLYRYLMRKYELYLEGR